jgi:hypothetical protein
LAQLAYPGVAESFTFNHYLARTRVEVQSGNEHERGFPRTIGAKHYPMLASGDIPRDIIQYGVGIALQGDVA